MPRIPVRTEPYTSPARQQRHYKNKRDQMLRTLGKASYINGSHFAILLVSAKGEVETFASELLKPCLSSWFNGTVVEEARGLATRSRTAAQQQHQQQFAAGFDAKLDASSPSVVPMLSFSQGGDDDDLALDDMPQSPSPTRSASPFSGALNPQNPALLRPGVPGRSQSLRTVPKLSPLDTDVANNLYKYRSSSASYAPSSATSSGSQAPSAFAPSPNPGPPQQPAMQSLIIPMSTLDQWYTEKLHSLQQTTCKLVAKCWIKVIEPKKQTKHPYNLGEEGKPIWWPKGLQHREPDHLLKPERTQLLLSILRSPLILVSRLELSTAEQNHLIPPERIAILRELYKVAREDEKRRRGEIPADQDIVVQIPAQAPSPAPMRMNSWPVQNGYASVPDMEYSQSRKRPRLSDQENDAQSWRPPYHSGDVGALHEQINGVPSPRLAGDPMAHCMPGQQMDMSQHGHPDPHSQFMYAPPPAWNNAGHPTLQLPAGDFYFQSPDGVSRPVTAASSISSRPLTAGTSASTLESDTPPDERMHAHFGHTLGVAHIPLQRSHSFPGPSVGGPALDMAFNPLTYPSQAYDSSCAGMPSANPFGFADPAHAFGGGHPHPHGHGQGDASLSASPDSWSSPADEQMQLPQHAPLGGLGAKDSPSLGMLQWLNESVHDAGCGPVDPYTASTPAEVV